MSELPHEHDGHDGIVGWVEDREESPAAGEPPTRFRVVRYDREGFSWAQVTIRGPVIATRRVSRTDAGATDEGLLWDMAEALESLAGDRWRVRRATT